MQPGIAFVTFATRSGLDAARGMSGSLFFGRAIKVSEARGVGPRESKGKPTWCISDPAIEFIDLLVRFCSRALESVF